jgi:hypothetical protein
MVRRSRSIPLPEPASLTNSPQRFARSHRYAAPATLRVAMQAKPEALDVAGRFP